MRAGRRALAAVFVAAGVLHLAAPQIYDAAMPPSIPAPRAMIVVSGLAEVAGGVGLLVGRVRQWAGWGVVALLVAVYPANVWVAVGADGPAWLPWARLPWARLPLQGVLVAAVLGASGAGRAEATPAA